jgi:hypothetical protein
MRFVRENLFYVILAAVVVVGGGVATFYYLNSDIGKTLASRTKVSSQLRGLDAQQLKVDLSAVEAMKARIGDLDQANKQDLQACLKFNRQNLPVLRLPISAISDPNAFPIDPQRYRDQGLNFIFIKQYTKVLEQMISPLRDGLRPTTPPTQEEIKAEKERLAEKFKEPGVAQEKAIQRTRLQKARLGLIYVEPSALDRVFTIDQTSAQEDKLWEAQVNLWLTDEIIRAIIATNRQWSAEQDAQGAVGRKSCVLDSAVKHLESIKVSASFTGFLSGVRTRASLGQRETCSQYAVVPYRFVVVMPTRHVRRLTNVLQTQNYHTVTNISLFEVPQPTSQVYYYGIEPVMRVQVDGEMLLLADWIRDLMPASLAAPFGKAGK